MKIKLSYRLISVIIAIVMLLSALCSCGRIISLDDIPEYARDAYVEINGGEPFFKDNEITDESFESYSTPDTLGRCGVAFACIGIDLMPTEDRGDIANVTPTGWEYNGVSNNNKYDFIDGDYVYNRCHLIGFQLAGENDNPNNLITGTRYMNIEGMLPFENKVDDYVEETKNHVMYRVTPIYEGVDLVARGVLMEALSVEDNGRGVKFCIFAYNVQPGVTIDYFTGINVASGEDIPQISPPVGDNTNPDVSGGENNELCDYVLNKNSKKFHIPGKSCAEKISEENRIEYSGTREDLIDSGYSPCGICKP